MTAKKSLLRQASGKEGVGLSVGLSVKRDYGFGSNLSPINALTLQRINALTLQQLNDVGKIFDIELLLFN
jgi:hypothetical protein